MKTSNGFTLMTADEFETWLNSQKVTRKITLIQEHHTYSPAYSHFYAKANNHFALQANMRTYHKSIGYADIAQNFTTFPDGTIMTGRNMNVAPAGCVGANSNGICIENLGNFDKGGDTMTAEQKNCIVKMTATLLKKFNLTAEKGVTYHGWWTADGKSLGDYVPGKSCKTCPGTNFFGGNTKASFNKNLLPLINAAMKGEDEEMTTEKFAEMMNEYLSNLNKQNPSDWSESARRFCEDAKIITGDNSGAKKYKGLITREECIAMIYRAVKLLEDK